MIDFHEDDIETIVEALKIMKNIETAPGPACVAAERVLKVIEYYQKDTGEKDD